MSEWQPIETAPKDGTRILIWGPLIRQRISYWLRAPHNYWSDNYGHRVTHWMPLPEPPQ